MRTVMPIHNEDSRPAMSAGGEAGCILGVSREAALPISCQQWFHLRWGGLRDPHVRSLAWLLDSPDLLNPAAPQWGGRIASLGPDAATLAREWLHALDASPMALHAYLAMRPHARLGRYAEKLLAFYFSWCRTLVAHGVQVRAGKRDTIGEFDFLLRGHGSPTAAEGAIDQDQNGDQAADQTADNTADNTADRDESHFRNPAKGYGIARDNINGSKVGLKVQARDNVWHCEFATKFYLLRGDPDAIRDSADYFVGPNLADTLGAKMEKILDRQLALSRHPAARALLQAEYGIESGEHGMDLAQALVKGWLFYPLDEAPSRRREKLIGVSPDHCRGFWCTLAQLREAEPVKGPGGYLLLPRLEWMPPALAWPENVCDLSALALLVQAEFERDNTPVMVAELAPDETQGGRLVEVRRGFVVPDDWSHRAGLAKPR
ncbi:MAG: hypothetical protein JWR22_2403 [Herminiimonas sp.]|nr:hypothetical protein [Herminiimonas sp.]